MPTRLTAPPLPPDLKVSASPVLDAKTPAPPAGNTWPSAILEAVDAANRNNEAETSEWNATTWVSGLEKLPQILARALLLPLDHQASSGAALEYVRALGHAKVDAAAVQQLLERAKVLPQLSVLIAEAAAVVSQQRAASAPELHSKFCADATTARMAFGGLSTFYCGLEGVLGPPSADLDAGVHREHCKARDSQAQFKATNYDTTTTTEIEYHFVLEPQPLVENRQRIFEVIDQASSREIDVDADGWPSEGKLANMPRDSAEARWKRRPRTLEHFRKEMAEMNERLSALDLPEIQLLEVASARLYTGPQYIKYNAVLRGYPEYATRQAHARFAELCMGNTYATTLLVINSAIGKLAKLTSASKVYRGVVGVLPKSFWQADVYNIKGGVEPAFISVTRRREVALDYASRGAAGHLFEMQMGMVDRGADLKWLSQYPHEEEILFPPLCGLEVQRSRVEAALLVLELKLSLNLRDRTIEELLTKMRSSHVSLVDMLLDEFRLAGAPLKALAPLTICREEALNEQPSEYNDPRHYSKRTQKALDAQEQVFELVSEARMWDGETPHSSHASTPQRGASPPPPEEAAPSNDAPASNGVAPVPSSGGESTGASEPASVGAASKRMSISLRDAPGDSVGEPTGKRHVERNLWALARKGMHDYLRNREKAHKQFSLARLCALHNHSDSAIKLLQMSLHNWPLRDESPRARIVQAALHAAGAKEEHRWRLEAAVLTDGMQQPWPSTMCTLIVRANDDNLTTAFAMLVAALEESSRFTVGARVLVWTPTPTTASADEGTWENGTITQLRWSDRKDVRLDNGMVLMARPLEHVLAVSEGGPGACLRSASKRGANMLMQAMLERGISPFEANLNGTTALHRAAKSGLVDTCKLLLNARADGYMANSAGASPFGEALTKGHMAVVRLFQPLLSDLDVTEFAHTASAFLDAAHRGDDEAIQQMLDAERAKGANDNESAQLEDALCNTFFANKITPLMLAARCGHVAVVSKLIECRANLLARSKHGVSALLMAVETAALGGEKGARAHTVAQMLLDADRSRRRGSPPKHWHANSAHRFASVSPEGRSHSVSLDASEVRDRTVSAPSPMSPLMPLGGGLTPTDHLGTPDDGRGRAHSRRITIGTAPGSTPLASPRSIERRPSLDGSDLGLMGLSMPLSARIDRRGSQNFERSLTERNLGSPHASASVRLVDLATEAGDTPLLEACASCGDASVDLVKLLLERGAAPNMSKLSTGDTPLTLACRRGAKLVVRALLDANANPFDEEREADADEGGEHGAALRPAAHTGSSRTVRARTALEAAISYDRVHVVNSLVDYFNEHAPDKLLRFLNRQSTGPFSMGARSRRPSSGPTNLGRTALMVACMTASAGAATSVQRLLELKADVELVDSFGYNALLYACDIPIQRFPNQKLASLLLAADADVDRCNVLTQETPLMVATRRGHARVAKLLVDANADVHAQTGAKETALLYASRAKEGACARLLMQHKARVDHSNYDGQNALHIAATHGNDGVLVQLLTLGGADHVNTQDHQGMTPLMIAAQYGWHHVCRVILTLCPHTNATLRNARGLSAVELALSEGHRATAEGITQLCAETLLPLDEAEQTPSANPSVAPSRRGSIPSRRGSVLVGTPLALAAGEDYSENDESGEDCSVNDEAEDEMRHDAEGANASSAFDDAAAAPPAGAAPLSARAGLLAPAALDILMVASRRDEV